MPRKKLIVFFICLIFLVRMQEANSNEQSIKAEEIRTLLDTLPGEYPLMILEQEKPVYVVRWSPNSDYIATVSTDNLVRVWNAQTGNAIEVVGSSKPIKDIVWSANGKFIAIDDGSNKTRIITLESALSKEALINSLSDDQRKFVLEVMKAPSNKSQIVQNKQSLFKSLPQMIQQSIELAINKELLP